MTNLLRVARAVGALVVCVALVVGVPVALVVLVGWPLPTTIPAWSTVSVFLRSADLPDAAVVDGLACIVWVAWAQLAAAIGWELAVNVPRVTVGKPKRPAPVVVNAHVGVLASRVVGAMLILSIGTRTTATTTSLPPAAAVSTISAIVAAPAAPAAPSPAPLVPVGGAADRAEWVVQPGDTLWAITESSTGSADHLSEVIALNADQITRPRDLRAGMVLRLPHGATVPADRQPPRPSAAPVPAHLHTVAADENLWSISADELRDTADPKPADGEVAPYWATVVAANTLTISNPDLIFPGEEVALPATPAEVAAAESPQPPAAAAPPVQAPAPPTPAVSTPPATTPPVTSGPSVGVPATAPAATTPGPSAAAPPAPASADGTAEPATGFAGWATPAGFVGATLLASWATLEARRRRSRRLRRSRAGAVMPPPDPTIAPTTVAIGANADLVSVDRLDAALRHLAGVDAGPTLPRPQVVLRHPNGEIEVFLSEGIEGAAEPWQARAGGQIWALAADAVLAEDPHSPPPCPALVQLGACDDNAELYADLEALGILGLAGPPEAVRQIARAITATLVVSPAAGLCRILTYGFDPFGLDDQAPTRLVIAPSVDALLAEAQATARPIVTALAEDTLESSFRLRAAAPDEGWEPAIVIVAGSPLSGEEASTLNALAGAGGQGAAVLRAGTDAPWTLEADEPAGWWRLNPLGIRVQPVGLAAEELRDLAGFLAEADAEPVAVDVGPAPIDLRIPPGGHPDAPAPPSAGNGGAVFRERDWRVMVRLLGPPDAVDRDGRPAAAGEREQPLELLAWLVTHRDTATRTGAMEALWAGRRVDPRSLTNVISWARNLLRTLVGEPPDGGEWIPSRKEQLVLNPAVVSDYQLLLDRLAHARTVGPAEAAAVLTGGVHLIRGTPLQGTEWQWADDQSVRSRLAVQSVEMATQLATLRLQAGDMRGASEASDLGHQVIPFHDECTALAIQALAEGGDRPAALAKYEDYVRQSIARGESVAPEVAKIGNEMLRT